MPAPSVLSFDLLAAAVGRLSVRDAEAAALSIPDERALDWMKENVPLFECPDETMQETFAFRWWTYRKHLRHTADGWVVTEFLPEVSWAGKHNTINCPLGHQLYEGRWIRDPRYLDDYARFVFRRGGNPGGTSKVYSTWVADALLARAAARGETALAVELLPDLAANWRAWGEDAPPDAWHRSRLLPDGSYWQIDSWEGMEWSVGGSGVRPLTMSYQCADAAAIAVIAALAGEEALAARYEAGSRTLRALILGALWDEEAHFFKTRAFDGCKGNYGNDPPYRDGALTDVRELAGYVPWYFGLPEARHAEAWRALEEEEGFAAPFGPTTAERRHPRFSIPKRGCAWGGPSWPFATSQVLTALARLLNGPDQRAIGREAYLRLLARYARSHRRTLPDGRAVPWIDESLNPFTGEWIPTEGEPPRGRDYNHSTFCDLVITGLVGLRPRLDRILDLNPLLPPGHWEWFCLDNLFYHGCELTVLYDRDGTKYRRGAGLRLLVNGELAASRADLGPLRAELP